MSVLSMSLAIHLHRYRNLVFSKDECFTDRISWHMDCNVAQDVSHCIPITVARVWSQSRLNGMCGGQRGTVTGSLQVLLLPLSVLTLPTALHSFIYHWSHIALTLTESLKIRHKIIMLHVHFSVTKIWLFEKYSATSYISKDNYGKGV
jgi:hypothetical protein